MPPISSSPLAPLLLHLGGEAAILIGGEGEEAHLSITCQIHLFATTHHPSPHHSPSLLHSRKEVTVIAGGKGEEVEGGARLDCRSKIKKEAVEVVGEEATMAIGGEGEVEARMGLDRWAEIEKGAMELAGGEAVTMVRDEGEEVDGGVGLDHRPEIEKEVVEVVGGEASEGLMVEVNRGGQHCGGSRWMPSVVAVVLDNGVEWWCGGFFFGGKEVVSWCTVGKRKEEK